MIISAAIWLNGEVYVGRRHEVLRRNKPRGFFRAGVEGFMTDCGIFMDRAQAGRHAYVCGQVDEEPDHLLSEDLW